VGLSAGLDRCGKSRPPPGFDPRTVQPVGVIDYYIIAKYNGMAPIQIIRVRLTGLYGSSDM
jgi:hypothetical protein